jgi:hypothetical protein
MQTYGRVEAQLHALLTSAPDEGEWPASRPGRFTLEERTPAPSGYEAWWAAQPVWTL